MWSFLNIEKDPVRVLVTGAAGMSNPLFFWFIFLLFDFFFLCTCWKNTSKYKFGVKYFLIFNMGSFYSNWDQRDTEKSQRKAQKSSILKKRLAGGYLFH
jgi:hypothetical protein